MGALVTLYSAILQTDITLIDTSTPEGASSIPAPFRMTRFWTWLARLVANADLMSDQAAPHILACALETAGDRAMEIWGKQMEKMVTAIARKALDNSATNGPLGGNEGKGGKVRLGLLLESWQKKGAIRPEGREMEGYDYSRNRGDAPIDHSFRAF